MMSLEPQQANGQGWSQDSPVRHVMQVIQKLSDGTYPTEATRCFCGGEPHDTVVTTRDRYTIPHTIVLCEHCCLMRANPRMTRAAYAAFYNDEYRKIYDGFPYKERSEDEEFLFQQQVTKGVHLKDFLTAFEVVPTSLVDIGCDKGGSLMPFKEEGATVYGVELCASGRASCASRGITAVPCVEDLIAQGVTVDLVVMQDVIEHFLDLEELSPISRLLKPGGHVFIYTPGLLASPPRITFQNAHTFQFIAATLEYVMERMGYRAEFLDDRIVSLWRYTGEVNPNPLLPVEWKRYIGEHLRQGPARTVPPVRTHCKFTERTMLANLDQNLAHHLPSIEVLRDTEAGPCVVVGGGPSVDGQIETIRTLVAAGAKLVVIERMYPWCTTHGLKADYVVSLDASEGVEDGFTHLQDHAIHLMVATNNPKVFPLLNGHKKYIWSGAAGSHPDAIASWRKHGYTDMTIINTGGSVTLGSIFLALFVGFRQVSLFGFDCMTTDTAHDYATGIAGTSVERTYQEVEIVGRPYWTCSSFVCFAQQFFSMMEIAGRWGMLETIDVYGPSLVNAMGSPDGDAAATWHYAVTPVEAVA